MNIPTCAEFTKDLQYEIDEQGDKLYYALVVEKKMIEFAKLHLQEAIYTISDKAKTHVPPISSLNSYLVSVDKKSILDAYPVSNVK